MSESGRDPEVSRRYRELARDEPPRALDEAILAAARRELETRPAPLVAPTARRHWTVPVAAAAVIVLSAIVTLQIQREQPDPESAVPPPALPAPLKDDAPAASRPAEVVVEEKVVAKPRAAERRKAREPSLESRSVPKPAQAPAAARPPSAPVVESAQSKPPSVPGTFAPDPPRAAPPAAAEPQLRSVAPAAKLAPKPAPRAAEAAGSAVGAMAPVAAERQAPESTRDRAQQRVERDAVAKRADESESPERTLEKIAALRREGRHKEADELYAEFRRRFPEYRIPEAMREQVMPR